ncbi:MAG: hypothetical protein AAF921_09910 [Cyanobacteria bacterium P01_D01_bin.44]
MSDFPSNPFIGNPFMRGERDQPPTAAPPLADPPPAQKLPQKSSPKSSTAKSATPKLSPGASGVPGVAKAAEIAPAKKTKKVRKKSAKSQAKPPTSPAPADSGPGYKVQVIATIPISTNTNLPGRDYLWFAVYPIIPRVGDCLFHDGRYFRVNAVFLYENTTPGWCADLEVSYYARRR